MTVGPERLGHDGRPDHPRCGASKRAGGTCGQAAGWGTPNQVGRCRLHGGSTPTHVAAAQREQARAAAERHGLPREVDPRDALLEEVYRTVGVVDWLTERIRELQPSALVWGVGQQVEKEIPARYDEDGPTRAASTMTETTTKAAVNVWVELHLRERRHLREVCRDAIAAGIAERQVRLAEQQGAMIVGVIRAILSDLNLSTEQAAAVAEVVPRHLRAVTAPPDAG